MEVYKFGGASVKDAAAVRNVTEILKENSFNEKVVVISAMGKTTNELERVVQLYYQNNITYKEHLQQLLQKHIAVSNELMGEKSTVCNTALTASINNALQFLETNNSKEFNYIYDQVVSIGEYLSTTLVSAYANSIELNNTLLNAKQVVFTDDNWTEGRIKWKETEEAILKTVPELWKKGFVIVQGFVGATDKGFTTTLGREGSDYTASVFAHCLNAIKMTIWKDVEGIMNADPKEFPDAVFIPELTYHEAIEMTYYGAKVIHPKTIKPIQNRNIPLEVRSFLDFRKKGSLITANANTLFMPPVIVFKRNQVLLSFSSKDFSFIAEEHLTRLFASFAQYSLRINMMQNAAISFSICVDDKKEKIDQVVEGLEDAFAISRFDKLSLLTIRHYNEGIISKLTQNKEVLLRQISRNNIQILLRE